MALACLLLASAGVCWVAANWSHASAQQKLAGAQAVLGALVLVAAGLTWTGKGGRNPNWSAPGLLMALAAMATGALLALQGQIYHTGADDWQLFMLWMALLLPWLLVFPTLFLGLAAAVLLNLGTILYLDAAGGPPWWPAFASGGVGAACAMVALNSVLLVLWERCQAILGDLWRVGPRSLAAAVAGWLIAAVFGSLDASTGPWGPVAAGLGACALLGLAYSRWRRDLAMVSLAALAGFFLVGAALIHQSDSEIELLGAIAVLLAFSALLTRWLLRLWRAGAADAVANRPDPGGHEPWPFSLFRLAVLAFIACLLVFFLLTVLDLDIEDLWLAGIIACAAGALVHRAAGAAVLRDTGLTLVAAGFFMAVAGFGSLDGAPATVKVAAILGLGLVLYVVVANPVLRFLLAILSLASATVITWPAGWEESLFAASQPAHAWAYLPAYLRLWWLSAAAVLAWAVGSRRRDAVFWLPLAWALAGLAQSLAWLAPAPTVYGLGAVWAQAPELIVIWLACALLPVLALGATLWRAADLPAGLRWGAPAALAVASAGWMGMPGIALALLWVILGRALGRKSLLVFGVLVLLAYLARFYYQMDASLLHKSLLLGLTGAWLALCAGAMRALIAGQRRSSDDPSAAREPPGAAPRKAASSRPWLRPAGLLAGLALVLAIVNTGIRQHERLLAAGRVVVLSLAPADPRSLMQGDYMALRFSVAQRLQQALRQAPADVAQAVRAARGGYMLLQPDENGVHRLLAIGAQRGRWWTDTGRPWQAEPAEGPATVILAFSLRRGEPQVVTDAWFFPEGQAARYEAARYGEIRVNEEGRGVLARLLDVDLQPLP